MACENYCGTWVDGLFMSLSCDCWNSPDGSVPKWVVSRTGDPWKIAKINTCFIRSAIIRLFFCGFSGPIAKLGRKSCPKSKGDAERDQVLNSPQRGKQMRDSRSGCSFAEVPAIMSFRAKTARNHLARSYFSFHGGSPEECRAWGRRSAFSHFPNRNTTNFQLSSTIA